MSILKMDAEPYPLNRFPEYFPEIFGKELLHSFSLRNSTLSGDPDWKELFARAIKGRRKPCFLSLSDIILEYTAWRAVVISDDNPINVREVSLFSGRPDPLEDLLERDNVKECDPAELGREILAIWNERVNSVRSHYNHLRTVVLIKSDDLLELSIFEMDTVMYQSELYDWRWNKNNNLVAYSKSDGDHAFTWQPHGSQFTITERVPPHRVCIRLKQPPPLDHDKVLATFNFDPTWVEIIKIPD